MDAAAAREQSAHVRVIVAVVVADIGDSALKGGPQRLEDPGGAISCGRA